MKELNKENYEAWVLAAFDFDELKRKEDLPLDEDFYWNNDYGLDELTISDGLIYSALGVHEDGLDIELWKYKKTGGVSKKKEVEKILAKDGFYLLRFIPENIPDLQKEAEEWLELEAKIDLKTWLEQ